MRPRDPLEPRIELAVGELDDAVAAGADEVVMMALAAPPVAELARTVRERVDDAGLGQEAERAVDGRQAELLAA